MAVMTASKEVPLLACVGPTGRAGTLKIVSTVLRFLSLAMFLSIGLVATLVRPGGRLSLTTVLLITCGLLLGFLVSLIRWFTLDRYVVRRMGRADVYADKVVIYKGDLVNEVEWTKVKRIDVKPQFTQIVRKGEIGGGSTQFSIPTPDPGQGDEIVAIWERAKKPAAKPVPGAAPEPEAPARESAEGGRILVAGGGDGWKNAKQWVTLGLLAVYLMALFRDKIRNAWFPWMPIVTSGTWELDFVILLITYQLVRSTVMKFLNARIGRAEFFPGLIRFYSGDNASEIAWSEIAGFDDGSTDFVRVLRRGGSFREQLAVPTPDEETRVQVLALFEERGIPRADPQGMVG